MAFTNTKENGLESLIVKWLIEQNGYEEGINADYNKEYAVDEIRLFRFLQDTQPKEMDKLGVFTSDTKKRQFLNRLSGEIAKRGIIDVLRNGVKVYPADLIMFYLTPTENNEKARIMYEKNIFSVTRQLRYSQDAGKLALDICLFINGLPVITMELKNQLTKQNTENAVRQYKEDRDFHDLLFSFKRCMVHFAVDDATIQFCTKLAGKDSWFLPFNKGYNDGAGNPPNPNGLMTDYLWKDILTKRKLSRIIENYAQVVEEVDEDTKKKSVKQIWPRYHQLDCVEKLLADVQENGVGKRYLIQHSAGSGKSNSIAWLAHQLIGLEKDGHPMIDSVLVVTDRRILDKQIRNTIKQFMQVKNTVVWAEHSGDLRKAIQDGKRIIISTIEKFPYIISEIGQEHKNNKFAIIIDEAHSGQSGRNSANMNLALSGLATDDEADNEDKINAMMEGRKLVSSASYFAFTATPKNKTEEMFGVPYEEDGEIKHRPFHVYTMKQAIQEGFILDVLRNYTTIDSWYKLMKTVEDDPMFDKKRAQKKLRAFVEGNPDVIAKKAAMMVEHFHEQVIAKKKVGGKARAMVVTASIPRCIEYYYAINKCLADRHSPYKTIVAFSGEHKYNGQEPALTSAAMNGFPDAKIPKEFKKEPYRILIVADMFQTGFDEPLLQTMYVDKPLYPDSPTRLLREVPQAPLEHRFSICGCAFWRTLLTTTSSPLAVVFFFLLRLGLLHRKYPIHIVLDGQQFPHGGAGLPVLSVSRFLVRQQLGILGLKLLDGGQLFHVQLIKGFLGRLVQPDLILMLSVKFPRVSGLSVGHIGLSGFCVVDDVGAQHGDLSHALLGGLDLVRQRIITGRRLCCFGFQIGIVQQPMLGQIVEGLGHLFEVEHLGPAGIPGTFPGLQFCLDVHQQIDLGWSSLHSC